MGLSAAIIGLDDATAKIGLDGATAKIGLDGATVKIGLGGAAAKIGLTATKRNYHGRQWQAGVVRWGRLVGLGVLAPAEFKGYGECVCREGGSNVKDTLRNAESIIVTMNQNGGMPSIFKLLDHLLTY